jgi:glycosyltransferase involved in cell wall biosynthesis
MQETNFPFEIVIHDDASTDGTSEIIDEYAKNYPDKFFPIIQKENQFSKGVRGIMAKFNLPRCKGKYIAWCEGDDYFTDSKKLQKQYDLLESNPNCKIVFHNCLKVDDSGKTIGLVYDYLPKDFSLIDTFSGSYAKTCTMMFVNNSNIIKENIIDDTTYGMELLREGGTAVYINEIMSASRVHSGGIWSQKKASEKFKLQLATENKIKNNFYASHAYYLNMRFKSFFRDFTFELAKEKDLKMALNSFFEYYKYEKSNTELINNLKHFVKLLFTNSSSKSN